MFVCVCQNSCNTLCNNHYMFRICLSLEFTYIVVQVSAYSVHRLTLLENIEEIKDATDCLPIFISKGIAMGCFYYARCLHIGQGVKKDKDLAQMYYSKVSFV